jgi:NAD(P)-dependent dehydrogenase (short-subunit alcohol dehydrogenase family)
MDMDFDGKVVLVTGGGSGIGRTTALAFARHGATVVVSGRRVEAVEETVAMARDAGDQAIFFPADLTEAQSVTDLHGAVLDRYGRLDIAFNNAGYQEPRALITEQDPALYDRIFDTNVRAIYLSMQQQIRQMAAQGAGVIVNCCSVSGHRNPNPGLALYSASKAALISLTRSAAMEAAERGVRVNGVAPGRVVTEMMLGSGIMDMKAVAAGLPIRRMGEPAEVAEAVLWLASPAASFVVGHILAVDGGFMAS